MYLVFVMYFPPRCVLDSLSSCGYAGKVPVLATLWCHLSGSGLLRLFRLREYIWCGDSLL